MKRERAKYTSEAEMCAQFISEIGDDWTAYAETAGWDILLVRKADGFQIGIEAKLRFNAHVIAQALESETYYARSGPDCRAVLVPRGEGSGFVSICQFIGLTVIEVWPVLDPYAGKRSKRFEPSLPTLDEKRFRNENWHECCPAKRHKLPEYVPDVAAGSSAPLQLTDWKIRAIKIAIVLERRGFVVRDDFRHIGIDHRRWIARDYNWLQPNEAGPGWVTGQRYPNLKAQHPRVYCEIEADFEKWKPADPMIVQPLPLMEKTS